MPTLNKVYLILSYLNSGNSGTVVTGVVFSFCHKILPVPFSGENLSRTLQTSFNLAYKSLQNARLLTFCAYFGKYEQFL